MTRIEPTNAFTVPATPEFSASDIQLAALAPRIPKLNVFKNEQYYSAEQLWDMGALVVNGSGTGAFNAAKQQIELKTTTTIGDWADLIVPLPISATPNASLGFRPEFSWGAAGQFAISMDFIVSRSSGPAPSGSNRPWANFYIERSPVAGAIEMTNEGIGVQLSYEFATPALEVKAHNGTTLTSEGVDGTSLYSSRGNLVLEHITAIASGDREFTAYQHGGGSGASGSARQLGTTQIDKGYTNQSRAANLHLTIGNNTKASAWVIAFGGVWISATQF